MQRSIGSTLAAGGLALAAILATAPSVAQSAAPAKVAQSAAPANVRARTPAPSAVSAPTPSMLPSVPALPRVEPPALSTLPVAPAVPVSASVLSLSPRPGLAALPSRPRASALDEQIASRNALEAAIKALDLLATRQRFGPTGLLEVPPRSPATAGISWLPGGRTGLPPRGMIVVPIPAAPVSAALIPIESTSTMVADARGNDAMLLGLQFLLPW